MSEDTAVNNAKDNRQFKIETVDDAVARGIQKAAPFYEAWPVLEKWLYQNGISLGNGGRFWKAMDQRPGHKGKPFHQTFNNLSEALTFALEHVKSHLQETEAAHE